MWLDACNKPPLPRTRPFSLTLKSQQRGPLTQCECVAARWRTEHSTVLAAELRGAVVAHREANAGGVPRVGNQPRTCLVQADLLLKLDRRHRCDCAEMAVERRNAHGRERCKFLNAQRLVVVDADPTDRAAQVRELAVGEPDLAHGRPLGPSDQPPKNLAL